MNMELNQIFSKYFNPCIQENSKVDYEECKRCGGRCCKAMGCHISPFDLKEITVKSIINLIDESQCISIDWWNGNPTDDSTNIERAYFLRIKNKNGKVIDPSYGGVCSILTDIGCPLSFEYRPKGARDLIPCNNDNCVVEYSKQDVAIDWLPYHDIMEEVYNYYYEKGDITDNSILSFEKLMSIMFGDSNEG